MSEGPRKDEADDARFEAAAIWLACMAEPGRSDAVARDFEAWLSSDLRNRAAYDEACQLHDLLAEPVARARSESRVLAPEPVAPASRGVGRRTVLRAAAGLAIAVGAGTALQSGGIDDLRSDHLSGVGGRSEATLPDGTRITLNTDTALSVDVTADVRRITLFRGEAFFEVAHDPARPFVVTGGGLTARAVGTSFAMRTDRPSVGVVAGAVEVGSGDGSIVLLTAGEKFLPHAPDGALVGPFDAATELAWRRGQIVFYRTPLGQVVAELDRYHRGRILVIDPDLRALEVSGIFGSGDPLEALNTIREILGITVTHVTDRLVLVS
jgi:transmembrane sensor